MTSLIEGNDCLVVAGSWLSCDGRRDVAGESMPGIVAELGPEE